MGCLLGCQAVRQAVAVSGRESQVLASAHPTPTQCHFFEEVTPADEEPTEMDPQETQQDCNATGGWRHSAQQEHTICGKKRSTEVRDDRRRCADLRSAPVP